MQVGDASKIWEKTCQEYLEGQIGELSYQTWIKPVKAFFDAEQQFVLAVPNELTREYVLKYADLIRNALRLCTSINFDLDVRLNADQRNILQDKLLLRQDDKDRPYAANESKLNPAYTFANFVVGPANSFAHAACVAVASMQDGTNFNPLFLYGGSGLGKTHLMQAIGNHVKAEFPQKKVLYVQTEQFVNEFIKIIASKRYDEFRSKYRLVDFLLIDDIQFIERKEQMQEEFFHTFNTILEAGKHIILTCDKPPASLTTLEERLKTRISSGLTIDITPPEYETRMAILDRLAQKRGILLPDEVRDFVASNITSNIRELEGAFKTLLAYSLLGNEMNLENARLALKDVIQPNARAQLDVSLIMNVTANYFHISVDDLKSKKRNSELVEPRHVAMYLCYKLVNMTYTDIGFEFGGKNHATVIHACNKITGEMEANAKLKHDIKELSLRLKP